MQDENWKSLFAIIGVTEQQMKEKSTREFIYNFVQNEGGIEAVRKRIEQETKPTGTDTSTSFTTIYYKAF